ncbi:Alkaline ceramidase 3 [Linnemannia hyalina]|uniref:Alkaline ceramidase 3 n=1 Tax=Linnemannia hyalina TaxID=64524 RepID=A0A9P7XHD6_9FUNG|nr:Alkaline ceramidase 3 [Linnemannia hyalina]
MAPTVIAAGSSAAFDRVGYWSPSTSSVDWCENNYVVSFYIAEFWNTISNAACFAAAVIAYHFFPGVKEARFRYLFGTLFLVGVGSMLFHGTLRHKMQLLDELPMLYSATIILFILVEAKHGPQGQWFPLLLAAWLATGHLQFYTFQTTYTLLQFGMIYYLRTLHVQQRTFKGPNPLISTLIRRALGFALFAVSIWLIDLRACETNLGYIGEKGANQQQAGQKQQERQQHQQPYVDHWMGLVPVIRLRRSKGV